MRHTHFRNALGLAYATAYTEAMRAFSEGQGTDADSSFELAVQLYTVPSIVYTLLQRGSFPLDLVRQLWRFLALNSKPQATSALASVSDSDPILGAFKNAKGLALGLNPVVDCTTRPMQNRQNMRDRFTDVTSILQLCCRVPGVSNAIVRDTKGMRALMLGVRLMQRMDVHVRARHVHVEFESQTWGQAFNLAMQVSSALRALLSHVRVAGGAIVSVTQQQQQASLNIRDSEASAGVGGDDEEVDEGNGGSSASAGAGTATVALHGATASADGSLGPAGLRCTSPLSLAESVAALQNAVTAVGQWVIFTGPSRYVRDREACGARLEDTRSTKGSSFHFAAHRFLGALAATLVERSTSVIEAEEEEEHAAAAAAPRSSEDMDVDASAGAVARAALSSLSSTAAAAPSTAALFSLVFPLGGAVSYSATAASLSPPADPTAAAAAAPPLPQAAAPTPRLIVVSLDPAMAISTSPISCADTSLWAVDGADVHTRFPLPLVHKFLLGDGDTTAPRLAAALATVRDLGVACSQTSFQLGYHIMEGPLSSAVFSAQVKIGHWVRNGASMTMQHLNYSQMPQSKFFLDEDLRAVQLAVRLLPPRLAMMLISQWFLSVPNVSMRTATPALDLDAMLPELLRYVIALTTELPILASPGPGVASALAFPSLVSPVDLPYDAVEGLAGTWATAAKNAKKQEATGLAAAPAPLMEDGESLSPEKGSGRARGGFDGKSRSKWRRIEEGE